MSFNALETVNPSVRGDFDGLLAITDGRTSVIAELEPVEREANEYREASKRTLAFMFRLLDFLASYRRPKRT